MYFDEGRHIEPPAGNESETSSRTGSARQQADHSTYDKVTKCDASFSQEFRCSLSPGKLEAHSTPPITGCRN